MSRPALALGAPPACSRTAAPPERLLVATPPGPSVPAASRPTILVVDDSPIVRNVIADMLKLAGFSVTEAGTGAEALTLVADGPDLVILDVNLPDIDGFEVCRRIKAEPRSAMIPVLHLSGAYRDGADRARGLEGGADAYLVQPVDFGELVATVKALLRLRRTEADLRASEARRQAAEALCEVARLLTQSLDLETVAQRIVDSIRALLHAPAAVLHRLDFEAGSLRAVAVSGDIGPTHGRPLVVPGGTGAVGLAVQLREPVVSPNVLTDSRLTLTPDARSRIEQAAYRAALALPLVAHGRVIGALGVGDQMGRRFADEEIQLAQAFADHAAVALENARLFEEVRNARDSLHAIAENSPDAMVTTDVHGRITYFSPGAEEIFGYAAGDVVARPAALFYRSGSDEALALMRRMRVDGRIRNYETAIRAKDGRWVEVSASFSLLRDESGAVVGTLGIMRDATEHKRSEEALAESKHLLRTIIETEPECVKLVAEDGTLIDMNRAGLSMIEADSLEQVAGTAVEPLVAAEYRPMFGALHSAIFRGESGELEFEIVGLKGTRRWLETHAVPLRNQKGAIIALLAVTRDTTGRKRAEEALRESDARLRQAQKMEAVGRLAGGIAHDFNNLLTVILGRSEFLRQELEPLDRRRRYVELIRKTAERAAGLTRQLLVFSRKQVLQPSVLDMNQIVAGLEPMLRRLIGEDIRLATVLAPAAGHVKADPGQLEQVLLNLVVNARDAMPQGGALTIETAAVDLDEHTPCPHSGTLPPGRYTTLAVRDTGVGMDEETKTHLFEPFFTTKGPDRGTGLGLATVYGIAKQSGGHICVESEPGSGAAFTIYLPCVTDAASAGGRPDPAEPAGGTETVLLVEDAQPVRDMAREILEMHGYTVLEARHPGEALVIAEQHAGPVHLLVTDVVMPQMSGRELAARLAILRPTMRVLYMSGYTDDAILRHGVLTAGTPFLEKPFTPGDLARKARDVLAGDERPPQGGHGSGLLSQAGGVPQTLPRTGGSGSLRGDAAGPLARETLQASRWIVVVRRGETAVFEALRSTLEAGAIAEVIWDRRVAEPGAQSHPVAVERRQREREELLPRSWTTLGFLVALRSTGGTEVSPPAQDG